MQLRIQKGRKGGTCLPKNVKDCQRMRNKMHWWDPQAASTHSMRGARTHLGFRAGHEPEILAKLVRPHANEDGLVFSDVFIIV